MSLKAKGAEESWSNTDLRPIIKYSPEITVFDTHP
jgi:hypothetical protein